MKNLCRICGVVCKGTLCVECETEAVERAEAQAAEVFREDRMNGGTYDNAPGKAGFNLAGKSDPHGQMLSP